MADRGRFFAAGALLMTLALAGCAPEPAPTPTPTGFASEEEAFAAAEATYRAYVDATNDERAGGDSDPTEYLTAQALQAEIDSQREFDDAGVSLVGAMSIASVLPRSTSPTSADIKVCLDVSETRVLDSEGVDVTPVERTDVLGVEITVVWSVPEPLISSTTASEESC